jgi:hypothetical protein
VFPEPVKEQLEEEKEIAPLVYAKKEYDDMIEENKQTGKKG